MATHPETIKMSIPMPRLIRLAATALAILVPLVAGAGSPLPSHAQGTRHTVFLPVALRTAEFGPEPDADDAGTWTAYADSDRVQDLAVDPTTGDVWAGTDGGAVKWDPSTGTYTRYTVQDGLADNRVTTVAVDASGSRWFYHRGDANSTYVDNRPQTITRLGPGGDWQTLPVPDSVPDFRIISMAARADGTLWLGATLGDAYRRDPDGTWQALPDAGCGWIYTIAVDSAGAPWFASKCGVLRLGPGGERQTWLGGYDVTAMDLVDGGPEAWFGSGRIAYHLRSDGTFEQVTVADGLPAETIDQIAAGTDGSVWFGTEAGLARRGPDGAWRQWTQQDDLPTLLLGQMVADKFGNAWLASSYAHGLHLVDRDGAVRHPRTASGAVGHYFWSVYVDRAGNRWFGSVFGGLSRLTTEGRWEAVSVPVDQTQDQASSFVLDIAEDEAGNLWLGSTMGLRRRSADGHWRTYTAEADGLPEDSVLAVLPDRDGSIWFGTSHGVGRLMPDDSVRTVDLPAAVTSSQVRAIRADAMGNRWFATGKGLARLAADGSWRVFTNSSAWDTAPDEAGGAWVATFGLAHVAADGTVTVLRAGDGVLVSDQVLSVHRTPAGGLWVGAHGGASYRAPDGRWTVFRRSPEAWLGGLNDIAVDTDGDVWFTDLDGAVWRYRQSGLAPHASRRSR